MTISKHLCVLKDVSRVFNPGQLNEITALHKVGLTLDFGEAVAIVGRSGSGKSTLLNILGLLDAPTGGSYLFKGQVIDWQNEKMLAKLRNRSIGFVFQEFALIPGFTVWDNIALPIVHQGEWPKINDARIRQAAQWAQIDEKLFERVEHLSGGQRQRVAIARALVNQPNLILADEPTGALDSETADEVLTALHAMKGPQCSVVIVTHDTEVAESCDRIIHIRDGYVSGGSSVDCGCNLTGMHG